LSTPPAILESSKSARPKRLNNIDALRGICALLVVIQHAIPLEWEGVGFLKIDPKMAIDFGRIGVVAFFLISGYVIPFSITRGEQPVKKFLIARFFRLWPAYWVAILLAMVTGASLVPLTFKNVALNATMFQRFVGVKDMVGPFWTLQIELIFYVLVTVMIATKTVWDLKYYQRAFYSLIAVSLLAGVFSHWHHVRFPMSLLMGLTAMFFAGYLRHSRLAGRAFPWQMAISYVVSLIPICLLGLNASLKDDDDPFRSIVAYLIGFGAFLIFEKIQDVPSVFVYMGAISYSIYLAHTSMIHVVSWYSQETLVKLFGGLALTILVASVVYRVVEKPCQALGKQIIRGLAPKTV
jgi:peptidoglycan/LPS O-acetylase OafA/YrhL